MGKRADTIPLDVPAGVGAGTPLDVRAYCAKSVQIAGNFDATIAIEGSIDGTNFAAVATPATAPAIVAVTPVLALLRVSVTAYTSGAPTAAFAGLEA
ncbi:MAG TPA: hypothetical protein VHK47_02060 [Polyangia bacterium]|nr:hypothetical protein [Polyangia bacterium]